MAGLNAREREIITARRLADDPATLEDLSQKFGVSRERIRQIEVRAFRKLQEDIMPSIIEQHRVLE
jgi:RNA polymerase sigma-32 factor